MLITSGAFTAEGDFLRYPEFDMERLLVAWQEAVFALYLAEEKIDPEVVENMRSWQHSGCSVDQSVFLPAGDQVVIERLIQYITRSPFSLSRLAKVSATGQVVYPAAKQACRAFHHRPSFRTGSRVGGSEMNSFSQRADFAGVFPV